MNHCLSRGALCAAALLVLSGCGRSVEPPASDRAPVQELTPSASATPVRATPTPSSTALAVERVPAPGPIGAVVTDGTFIAWSGGDPEGVRSPNLYRWKIGSTAIEEVYRNPEPNRGIGLPAMDGDRVAFSESGATDEGFIDWNFLYVARPGARPIKLASARRPLDAPGVLPQPTISGERLVYALQTISGASAISQLISVDLRTMAKTVLAASDFDEVEYWYPSLDGDRLVYGTVEYANDPLNGERHVYLLDLADPDGTPRRLDDDGEASQPAINGDTVVWKSAPRDFNANNWGQVIRYSLSSGKIEPLDFLGESTGYYLMSPHLGPRFVAAEPSDWTRLAVYDLETHQEITVEELAPTSDAGFMRPSLGGDVYAWVAATDFTGSRSEIHFVRLPPP